MIEAESPSTSARRHAGTECRILGLLLLVGCSSPFDSGDCVELVFPAVTVEIRELGSGRPLADSAKGVVQTGTHTDSLRPYKTDESGQLVDLQGYGPAGTYRVEVQRAGFRPWAQDNIRVTAGRCGDKTVALRADLVATTVP